MSNKTWRWIREEIRDFCDFSSHNFYRISLEKVNDVNEDFWEIYRCGMMNDVEFVWRSTVGYCSSAIAVQMSPFILRSQPSAEVVSADLCPKSAHGHCSSLPKGSNGHRPNECSSPHFFGEDLKLCGLAMHQMS